MIRSIKTVSDLPKLSSKPTTELSTSDIIDILDQWSKLLLRRSCRQYPALLFLQMWLKKNNLLRMLNNEFADTSPMASGYFPVGTVGHWSAGNVPLMGIISAICSVLTGNNTIVRLSNRTADDVLSALADLALADENGLLAERLLFVQFDYQDPAICNAFAQQVQACYAWGGTDAIAQIRQFDFPANTNIYAFGPRMSVALLASEDLHADQGKALFEKLARDVWQFDQAACSSPQLLFLPASCFDDEDVMNALTAAFEREQQLHPELTDRVPQQSYKNLLAQSSHLFTGQGSVIASSGPAWSLLIHEQLNMPEIVQGKTLHVVPYQTLADVVGLIDRDVQTVGISASVEAEQEFINQVFGKGIDRIVPIGNMHIFDSPWDGAEMLRLSTRKVSFKKSL